MAAEMPLKRNVSGWIAGNLVFANPIAMQGYDTTIQADSTPGRC
jgi:hypothetical protein